MRLSGGSGGWLGLSNNRSARAVPIDQQEYDLNALYRYAKRELERCKWSHPWLVAQGTLSPQRAEEKVAFLQALCNYLVDAIFREVTRQGPPSAVEATMETWLRERRGKIKTLVKEGKL
jgi:hypothetical protein